MTGRSKDKENFLLQELEPEYCDRLDKLHPHMTDRTKDNPFYSNHVFTAADLLRFDYKPTLVERILLKVLPTYAQIAGDCNYVFFYKRWNGQYYLIEIEKFKGDEETISSLLG